MLEISRQIERMIYPNSTLSTADYPLLDRNLFEAQELERLAFDYSINSLCYTYIREYNGGWFVDIYYYYAPFFNNQIIMKRFIIAPGFQMDEKNEEDFSVFTKADFILYNTRVCPDYVKEISDVAPGINMKPYKDVGLALFHTYYASFRSGIRELLLKAGLEYVAIDVSTVDGWNMIASNIEDAFGIPLGLMKKLNYQGGIENAIANDFCRRELIMAYKQFHSMLNDISTLNEFQIRYLRECFSYRVMPDKRLLIEFADLTSGWDDDTEEYIDGNEVYWDVIRYHSLNCYKNIFPQYPSLAFDDLDRFYKTYYLLREYIEHEAEFDHMMKKYAEKYRHYRYCDEQYEIIIPKTIKDVLEESEQQHNCLYQSVKEILRQDMVVVFMRERSKKKKSLVTIEVGRQEILQVKACCNRDPSDKQMMFIGKFAKAKGLLFKDFMRSEYKNKEENNKDVVQ